MRALLVVLLLAFVGPLSAKPFDQQDTVVELLNGSDRRCSAVVIAPGVLVSAGHCLVMGEVDAVRTPHGTFPITGGKINWPADDTFVIYAPGVTCPCAKTTDSAPIVGEAVRVVGYPGEWHRVISEGKVLSLALLGEFWAMFGVPEDEPMFHFVLIFHDAFSAPGMSGGGTFVERDGEWVLIGNNSVGAPIVHQSGAQPLPTVQ